MVTPRCKKVVSSTLFATSEVLDRHHHTMPRQWPHQGKARRTSSCCFFSCALRWIVVCLEDGSSATKAAELEKDLLTSCACWCMCLGFEACPLHSFTTSVDRKANLRKHRLCLLTFHWLRVRWRTSTTRSWQNRLWKSCRTWSMTKGRTKRFQRRQPKKQRRRESVLQARYSVSLPK